MDIYNFVKTVCHSKNVPADTTLVQRFVGTLRSAGFSNDLTNKDMVDARLLIIDRLTNREIRTAGTASETPITSVAKFQEIHSFMSENKCPRCKETMESVKLANYEAANYCSRCKVALWQEK